MEYETVRTMPRIGDKVPEFKATTTQGSVLFPSDYSGKWVILFSHPSDFTPVCTSEFMLFGSMAPEFEKLNCRLVGLSVGSLYSHIAWLKNIHEKVEFKGLKNVRMNFPLIDDISMNVARMYGMIHPGESDTKAVRALFFIDPKGVIRAIVYYPMALGRNFDEMKRVLVGLQTIDRCGVALPADWRPGDEVMVANPPTYEQAQERMEHQPAGTVCSDWFFCMRPLSKEEAEKAGRRM